MADPLTSFNGAIGGQPTTIFVGTPGLPGAQVNGSLFSGSTASAVNSFSNTILGPLGLGTVDVHTGQMIPGSSALGNIGSGLTDLFLRGVVIILGFIFVAIGLSMFREHAPIILESAGRGVRSLGKKVTLQK